MLHLCEEGIGARVAMPRYILLVVCILPLVFLLEACQLRFRDASLTMADAASPSDLRELFQNFANVGRDFTFSTKLVLLGNAYFVLLKDALSSFAVHLGPIRA